MEQLRGHAGGHRCGRRRRRAGHKDARGLAMASFESVNAAKTPIHHAVAR